MTHDGRAAAKHEAAVTTHLRDCPACRQFQTELAAFGGKLRAAGEWEPAPSRDIRRGALERWNAEGEGGAADRRPWLFALLAGCRRTPDSTPNANSASFHDARRVRAQTRWAQGLSIAAAMLLAVLVLVQWEQIQRASPSGPTIAQRGSPAPSDHGARKPYEHTPQARHSQESGGASPPGGISPPDHVTSIAAGSEPPHFVIRPAPNRRSGDPHPAQSSRPSISSPPSLTDEQYLDGRDPSLLARWSAVGGNEQERLAAILKRLPPPADDFARIPYPQIAGIGGAGIAAAVQQYKDEAKVVDARLFRKVTLQDKGVALSDLCAELQAQTGAVLHASRTVADEKVTIFVKEEPARDVMRAVSHLFGYFWMRSGHEGEYRYELDQDLKSQLAEEEMRSADLHAALLQIDREMAAYRPLLQMDVDQLRPLLVRTIDELKARGQRGSPEERRLFNLTYADGWGGAKLYEQLTPAERAALANGQELVLRSDAPEPERRLSQQWADSIRRLWSYGGDQRPRITRVRLRLDRSELGQLSLVTSLAARSITKEGYDSGTGTYDLELATVQGASAAKPENGRVNRTLRDQPSFRRLVSVEPETSCVRVRAQKPGQPQQQPYGRINSMQPGPDLSKPHVFSSDAWEAIHRATGLPIVADYYTRVYSLSSTTVKQASLFEALCQIGDALGVRWRKEGEFLLGRSTNYYWDRLKEVPNRSLLRWQREERDRPGLSLESLQEMASLPDEALNSVTVAEAIHHCWGIEEWGIVSTDQVMGHALNRTKLRFLAELTPEHRRRALDTAGLSLMALTSHEQQGFLRVLQAMDRVADRESGGSFTLPTQGNPRFCVEYVPAGWYVWTPPDGTPERPWPHPLHRIIARTAAAALAAARQTYPEATADQVTQRPEGELQGVIRIGGP
jgi:hypothetical protein